jgi:hypothetical protein
METSKRKLDVENAFANWWGCVGCLACYNPLAIPIVLASVVVVASTSMALDER